MTTRLTIALGILAVALQAAAAPSIELTNVQQQYPWTNTVDIAFTVSGVTNDDFLAVFEAVHEGTVIGAVTNDIKGVGRAASAVVENTTQWYPPFDLKLTGVTIVPYVYRREVLGFGIAEYIVVDLSTGAVTYEGLKNGSQAQSNTKYNTTEYKTSKMVFRLVKPGTYTIGLDSPPYANYGLYTRTAVVPKDDPYYIAIFRLTNAQYQYMNGSSGTTATAYSIAYSTLRGTGGIGATPASSSPIYKMQAKIESRMGSDVGFKVDIPTYQMHLIASQAGKTTKYFWGSTTNAAPQYVFTDSSTGHAVGAKKPNSWGIYESSGGYYLWFRDGTGSTSTTNPTAANMKTYLNNLSSIYQPITATYSNRRLYDRNLGSQVLTGSTYYFQGSHYRQTYSSAYENRLALYPAKYYPSGVKSN